MSLLFNHGQPSPYNVRSNTLVLDSGLQLIAGAAVGDVLTSDASGNATWQPNTGPTPGDNIVVANPAPMISILDTGVNSNNAILRLQGQPSFAFVQLLADGAGNAVLQNLNTAGNMNITTLGTGILTLSSVDGGISLRPSGSGSVNLAPVNGNVNITPSNGLVILSGANYPVGPYALQVNASNQIVPSLSGTFTPSFQFDVTTSGLTYSTQIGKYTQVGNVVQFFINVVLSGNSATSVGNASIVGLTIPTGTGLNAFSINYNSNLTYTGQLAGFIESGATAIKLTDGGPGGLIQLTNTAFNSLSQVRLTGIYFTS
jgi:hypothetical protein